MHVHSSKAAIATLVMSIMLVQGASATWYNHGTFEPDNSNDDPTLMRTDPPGAIANRIYFNAYTGTAPGLRGTLINPNVGALGTTNEAPALEYHMAILGVWVDCNGDGYVGLAETASQEYPAALLADLTICPAVSGNTNVWTAGAHNYNGWVTEYVPIGGQSDIGDWGNDSRVYVDNASMVWGDNGLYTDSAAAGGACPLAPQPRGTYQSTGGFINWIECNPNLLERWNQVWNGGRFAGVVFGGITPLTGFDPGLDFQDPNNASGTWADYPTFGTEDTANSPARVWDCSSGPALHSGNFVNSTLGPNAGTVWTVKRAIGPTVGGIVNRADNITVFGLAPGLTGNPNPTAPAFVNSTQEGLNVLSPQEDCNTANDDGHDFYGNNYVFYVGETDFNRVSTANKTSASWNLQFQDTSRDQTIVNLPANQGPTPGSPVFGGRAGAALPAPLSSTWNSPSVLVKTGPRHIRLDLLLNDGAVEINAPTTFTFYAYVGQTTLDRGFSTPGGSGVYAGPQCGTNDSGIHNGFNCNKALWYRNPDGSPVPEPTPLARPGQVYQFRDTDCYDGRNGVGPAIGVTAYGASPCVPYGG